MSKREQQYIRQVQAFIEAGKLRRVDVSDRLKAVQEHYARQIEADGSMTVSEKLLATHISETAIRVRARGTVAATKLLAEWDRRDREEGEIPV